MTNELSADEALTTTRAVRKRLDLARPVPRELLLECLEIAVQAPTGSNRQGWHFVFISDPDTKRAVAGRGTSGTGGRRQSFFFPSPRFPFLAFAPLPFSFCFRPSFSDRWSACG